MSRSFRFLLLSLIVPQSISGLFLSRGFDNTILPLRQVHGLSWDDCLKECERMGLCRSVSFRRYTHACSLYTLLTSGTTTLSLPGTLYGEPDWRTSKDQVTKCIPACYGGQTCASNGTCVITECDEPHQLPVSQFLGNLRGIGAKVKHTCVSNYVDVEVSDTSTCMAGGTWSSVSLTCDCGQPTQLNNTIAEGNDTILGANMTLSCSYGDKSTNDSVPEGVLMCQSNGQWSETEFACEKDLTNMTDFDLYKTGFMSLPSTLVVQTYGNTDVVGVSRQECAESCRLQTEYCVAISYRSSNKTCILVDHTYGVVNDHGWDVFHKYTGVWYTEGPNGWYTLNYAGAVAHCTSAGTAIATLADVQYAYDRGFNKDQCGWIEGQKAMIMLHFPKPGIYTHTGINQCTWRTTWGVYCKQG